MTKSVRPRIGYTTGRSATPNPDAYAGYTTAIEAARGEPVPLDGATLGREVEVLRALDGLLLTGGYDIDLRLYPNPPELNGRDPAEVMAAAAMELDVERDRYELPLIRAAVDRDIPVFGICRGVQSLAVALGGRLVLDIPSHIPDSVRHHADRQPPRRSASHGLAIQPGSRLATILGPDAPRSTNSRHHQAVLLDEACPGVITAFSPEDDVPEALEIPGRRWVVGVQWHPEYLADTEVRTAFAPLFHSFVAACRDG
jgi:putative glutamine amidotransferase